MFLYQNTEYNKFIKLASDSLKIYSSHLEKENDFKNQLASALKSVLDNMGYYKNAIDKECRLLNTSEDINLLISQKVFLGKYFEYNSEQINNLTFEEHHLVLENIYVVFFAYFTELKYSKDNHTAFQSFYNVFYSHLHEFSNNNRSRVLSILMVIPLKKIEEITNIENMRLYIDFSDNVIKMNEVVKKSEDTLKNINIIDEKLKEQKNEFNFIGLSHGFQKLRTMRTDVLNAEESVLKKLKIILFSILCVKTTLLFIFIGIDDKHTYSIALSLSTVFLIIIIFYFIRISLLNIKSLKSQILQIDLRMTLCQFIHNYSTDSKDIKNGLEKFENIIFSSILPNDEQIPSTFDGIEQISKIVEIMNPTKKN